MQGRDINLDIQRVVAYRQFCNKLWQATRFALLNFDAEFKRPDGLEAVQAQLAATPLLSASWILHRLHLAVAAADAAFKNYEFAAATTAIYNFWLYDLCDVYLVRTHTRRARTQTQTRCVLHRVFAFLHSLAFFLPPACKPTRPPTRAHAHAHTPSFLIPPPNRFYLSHVFQIYCRLTLRRLPAAASRGRRPRGKRRLAVRSGECGCTSN